MRLRFPEIQANVFASVSSPSNKPQSPGFVAGLFAAFAQSGLLDGFARLALSLGQTPLSIGLSDKQDFRSLAVFLQQSNASFLFWLELPNGWPLCSSGEHFSTFAKNRCHLFVYRQIWTRLNIFLRNNRGNPRAVTHGLVAADALFVVTAIGAAGVLSALCEAAKTRANLIPISMSRISRYIRKAHKAKRTVFVVLMRGINQFP
jgi:hypothetical protein